MAWIELHQSVWTHRKTFALAASLNVSDVTAVGHLARLWCWALDNVGMDGCLNGIADPVLARAAGWHKSPAVFVTALIESGYVDDTAETRALHDWDMYAGRLIGVRAANRDRQRMSRARHASVTRPSQENNGAPYPTQPTVPNQPLANASKRVTAPREHLPVTPDYLKEIQPLHPLVNVCDVYADASNRKVWDGYKDKRRALGKYIVWAEEKESSNGRTNTPAKSASRYPTGEEVVASGLAYLAAHPRKT